MITAPNVFPRGCRGAVSLTYDDGPDAHLDHAMPDLESAGLRGTFYVPTHTPQPYNCWSTRPADWKAAAARGHEIGNHTQFHPCSADWVKPNFKLEAYSLARMEAELVHANEELTEVTGVTAPKSFAYPCSQSFVGPDRQSYQPIVSRLFPAARTGSSRKLIDPMTLDFTAIPAWKMDVDTDVDLVTDFLDEVIDRGGWAVLLFHGVDGGHTINVTREFHRVVCKHIAINNEHLWCDTFLAVALYIRNATRQPWTA